MKKQILSWYDKNKRDLPWRNTEDPYPILVSEVMLQQTQVDRVIPKYYAFLQRFPTIETLARAERSEVIKEWSGLGYNRRAVYLHEFAKKIAELSKWPNKPDELMKLPGIGPYTSKSVLVFAHNADETLIEANIRRIYLRIFLGNPETNPAKEIEALAIKHTPRGKSRDWHNALMDFGSQICTAKNPSCDICPVMKECVSTDTLTKDEMQQIASSIFKTKQSKFEGSNRWYRSKIVKLLQKKDTVTISSLGKKIKDDYRKDDLAWLCQIVDGLVRDGLIKKEGKSIRLA